jgi:hypothetical protein
MVSWFSRLARESSSTDKCEQSKLSYFRGEVYELVICEEGVGMFMHPATASTANRTMFLVITISMVSGTRQT